MRITKCLIVIGCFMLLTMSVCFAKISEVNDPRQTIFNSSNIITNQDIKVEAFMVKLFYPSITGYRFGFDQTVTINENESVDYITEATLQFDGTKTYVLPRGNFNKLPLYGESKGKYLTEARVEVYDNENDVKVKRLVNLIKSADKAEVVFTFKNGEKLTYEIASTVLQEWKQVVAYPDVI
ncbi:hypothetical protein [Succinispira mobilis]|uniref:hypothetical protein n=1 Tax=Succinispira mobilis TaxID=78120 RepID=UPI00037B093B|nr:hypothetical protein [Succinispira mobilis]